MDTHEMLMEMDHRPLVLFIEKKKEKAYWIEIFFNGATWVICLRGMNKFLLRGGFYEYRREANQQAKRLAKALGLEFRQ